MRRRNLNTYVVGLSALLALPAASGCGDIFTDSCYSPRAESGEYPGNPHADPEDQSTWTTGVLIEVEPPAGPPVSWFTVVGHASPVAKAAGKWIDSEVPINGQEAADWGQIVKIGRNAVYFSVRYEGETVCDEPPTVTFSPATSLTKLQEREPQPVMAPFTKRGR